MPRVMREVLRSVTQNYLDLIDVDNPPQPIDIQEAILEETNIQFQMENACKPKGTLWKIPNKLCPQQIADILYALHNVVNIAYGGLGAPKDYDILSIYVTSGEDEGIYSSSEQEFHKIIKEYEYTASTKDIKEVMALLKSMVPRVERNNEPNLIAVNNGIFDYDTKQLLPFSPEYIFISKSKVDYNPNAINVILHNDEDGTDWDIESWMDDLFDNKPEMTKLIWQIIGAIIRPNVPWNKSAWFYSNTGNNGKGTLCELMRQIAGEGTYAAIPLTDFAKDFMLEPLIQASCIIVDENDVGSYVDKAANLKAIITNDVIQINRKHKAVISFRFKGFMVQCLNELPKIKDRSESFYRRQLFVPFSKCFTGAERKYIKVDYLRRKEVLEYALYKVLNMNYYSLDEPPECKAVLEEYKSFNDLTKQFADEMFPQFKWDLLPYTFLYDLYKEWFKRTSPTGTSLGRPAFIQEINRIVTSRDDWNIIPDKMRPRNKMDKAEPLIHEYNLMNWLNPNYRGNDIEKRCHPSLKENYRGLVRA